MPIDLPEGMLEEIYPEPAIGGEPLYHPEHRWYGAAVSSFGIIYNRDVLQMLNLPEPRTWADLQSPSYRGWVALSDPAHSGSIAATYNIILRRKGWADGWHLLRRAFANARYFTSSSSQIPVDVSAGEAAAGMCIDFYGRFQAQAIGRNRVGYVDPKHMTATTADPIAMLRSAPHRELARQFIMWVLSKDAQRLWQRRVGALVGRRSMRFAVSRCAAICMATRMKRNTGPTRRSIRSRRPSRCRRGCRFSSTLWRRCPMRWRSTCTRN